MKTLILSILLVLSILITYGQTSENKSKKQLKAEKKAWQKEQIKNIVRNKNFVFKAQSVNPSSSTVKTLTTEFGIEVKNDSVFSYMPYFGKTYARDYDNFNESPMGFIQPIAEYSSEKLKNEYLVRIKVNNMHDVVDLAFHISFTGNTTVTASSIKRQSISYDGLILIPLPEEKSE